MPRVIPKRYDALYGAVAFGMLVYVYAAFRVVVLGRVPRLDGHLLVSTHRSDADVPLICANLFFRSPMWRTRKGRPHFAARDDLFERGVLAGLAPWTPLPLRRLLFAVDPARYLPSMRVHPIRSSTSAKAAQAIGGLPPATRLDAVLPPPLAARFTERGIAFVGDALRADVVDLLWTDVSEDEVPERHDFWRRRAQEATADVRNLVAVVTERKPLLVFPEGRPSPDGSIGPLRKGAELLVRRGRPVAIAPIGLAYDPLTRGKVRACVAFGQELAPPAYGTSGLLDELRRVTPLTCGQVVAHRLLAGSSRVAAHELDGELAAAVARAGREGRHVDSALVGTAARRARLSDCLRSLVRDGVIVRFGEDGLHIDRDRADADPRLRRLATEYVSARASHAATADRR